MSGLSIQGNQHTVPKDQNDTLPDSTAEQVAKNLHAKKFGASQRAIIAARLRPFYDKLAKDRQGNRNDLVQKIAQSDQHRIYSLAEEREAFDRKKARDEAGKAATKKVTQISLHSNGANGRRCW